MKTFVGFGFGPIQSALFLFEAFRSGQFARFVIAEVDSNTVRAIRNARGTYTINIALPDRIERATIRGVELYDPAVAEDRHQIVQAIAKSDEIATCLPSVAFFDRGGDTSVARMLADGFSRRPPGRPGIVYTAENNNHAAELLQDAVQKHWQLPTPKPIQFLNTVIGKMSGVISDATTIATLSLGTLTPELTKAVLVEEFNRILVSRIDLPGFSRGISVFIEKKDLLPFEEAKLYGHNAIHALIGFLAARQGLHVMSEAAAHPDIMACARAAFITESGAALVRKYRSLDDPLFTEDGFSAYAEDLLARMVRPTLNDLVARVTRDQVRKLGYDDRIFGAMRLALNQNIRPVQLAHGAAAAVRMLLESNDLPAEVSPSLPHPQQPLSRQSLAELLHAIWGEARTDRHADELIDLTWQAFGALEHGNDISAAAPSNPPPKLA